MGKVTTFSIGPDGRLIPDEDPVQPWVPKPPLEEKDCKCEICGSDFKLKEGQYKIVLFELWPRYHSTHGKEICKHCATTFRIAISGA